MTMVYEQKLTVGTLFADSVTLATSAVHSAERSVLFDVCTGVATPILKELTEIASVSRVLSLYHCHRYADVQH